MKNDVPSLDDLTNALAPINRGFLIRGFLSILLSKYSMEKVIFHNLQSIDGLCFFNHDRPRIRRFDGVLMMLKVI